jgi:small GTP-binding protein
MESQRSSQTFKIKYKIMLLGNMAVGKSSIMYRFTDDNFNVNIMGTAGLEIKKKLIKLHDTDISLNIYDFAGQDRFRKITKSHYKDSNGIILIYDVTDRKAFESVSEWINQIKINTYSSIEIILVGNKIDMINRIVTEDEGKALANKYNVPFIETSALTGYNIEKTFITLVEIIFNKNMSKISLITDLYKQENTKKKKKKSCCG